MSNTRYNKMSLGGIAEAVNTDAEIDVSNKSSMNASEIMVIKRNGSREPFMPEKMRKVCEWACEGKQFRVDELIRDTVIKLHKEINIRDMFQQVISTAVNKISLIGVEWEMIAAKLYLADYYKETANISNVSEYPHIEDILAKGLEYKIYDRKTVQRYSPEELEIINGFLVPERDFLFNYKGLVTFTDKYCLNYTKTRKLELPQHSYMRVALALMVNETNRLEKIKEYYDDISLHRFTVATPIILNALTPGQQLSSCVLNTLDDDSHSILDTGKNLGIYSKFKGGTALDISAMRAKGGYIEGTQGYSSGPVPFMKYYESIMKAWNQGGKRPGALAVYFSWWHLDVFDILSLKSNGGTDENRARGLQYAVKVNEFFVDAVINDKEIYLFDPRDVPALIGKVGPEFVTAYETYANKNIRKKKVNARELWEKIFKERSETGNIYLFHEENVNNSSMLNRYIGSSNLCLVGNTMVETINGPKLIKDIVIGDLVYSMDTKTGICSYKPVTASSMTNPRAEVIRVSSEETDVAIECTPEHQVWTENRGYVQAKELFSNDVLTFLRGEDYSSHINVKIENVIGAVPVYDITVEDNHNFFANGILVHNCTEITLPSRPSKGISEELITTEDGRTKIVKTYEAGEIALCNLSSLNLEKWHELTDDERMALVRIVVRGLDNTVDVANYPVKEGKFSNQKYRYLGIGVMNYANYLALRGIAIDTQEAAEETDALFDDLSFKIITASMELAIEKGRFPAFHETEWAKGILPIHKANPHAVALTKYTPDMAKWAELAEKIKKFGIRNAQLMAIAPTATSGKSINAIESIEPVHDYFYKEEGTLTIPTIAPNFRKNNRYYTRAFDCDQYALVRNAAIRQKWIDQSQSVNLYISTPDSLAEMSKLHIYGFYLGMKTFYYLKQRKGDEGYTCESCT